MPEEQSQTIMAVDELQAIIQRCVSSFLSIKITHVSSVHFSSYILIKNKMTQNTRQLLAELLIGQLSSASMLH